MHRHSFWILACLAALAALATLLAREGDAGAAAKASATKKVDIRNFAFKPATLRVQRGGRVTFTNSSSVTHTATKGGSFDTKRIAPGSSAVVGFDKRGTFAYHCKIHPYMKGKIVVE